MLDYLKCLLSGCPPWPKRIVSISDPSMPRGGRYAMACARCGSVSPVSEEHRQRMAEMQRTGR